MNHSLDYPPPYDRLLFSLLTNSSSSSEEISSVGIFDLNRMEQLKV